MIYACIFASGRGTRMCSDLPKQFLNIDGQPIIIKCIKQFLSVPSVDKIIVAVPKDYIEYTEKLLADNSISGVEIISGGSSRNGTLLEFLKYIPDNDGIILTHDAARPFVSAKIIENSIASMNENIASTVALSVVDSVILSDELGNIEQNLNRDRVFLVQTPQTFRLDSLRECVNKTDVQELEKMTDCTAIFRKYGLSVAIVPGEKKNIKITNPEDLENYNA